MSKTEAGKKLRKLRGAQTLQTVAANIGISRSALNMYEKGERSPRDEIKIKLANYYKATVQEIFYS